MTGRGGVRVPDEPSNSELAWRLDDMRRLLNDLIGRAEYQAHQQGIDLRFGNQGSDIQDLRRDHDKDVQALHTRISDHEKSAREGRFHWQQILFPSFVALAVAVAGILTELWIAAHK